jgi:pyruvate decarboxylase
LVDACSIRHRVLEEVRDLVEKSGLPTFVTPMGTDAQNEVGGLDGLTDANVRPIASVDTTKVFVSLVPQRTQSSWLMPVPFVTAC